MVGTLYQHLAKPLFFKLDPEKVHTSIVHFGEIMGQNDGIKEIIADVYAHKSPSLNQKVAGINFASPIGLAAGFDYEARLTQILSPLGFGFQTIGSITNSASLGNTRPRLGRLPKSQSLLVNKGLRNPGSDAIIKKLAHRTFAIPLGVSIGQTNSSQIASYQDAIRDIVAAFVKFEQAKIANSFYELNISCPNLLHSADFYSASRLTSLLTEIDKLHLPKPLFVKMPISQSNKDTAKLIEIITLHCPAGIIIGNLQKDRSKLISSEAQKITALNGNLSGKPTFDRSNELITLAYRYFGQRLTIIGCGGVFSPSDAWEKIIRGATLVQLITGLVFVGPQLVSDINHDLAQKLHSHGLKHLSEAVGAAN